MKKFIFIAAVLFVSLSFGCGDEPASNSNGPPVKTANTTTNAVPSATQPVNRPYNAMADSAPPKPGGNSHRSKGKTNTAYGQAPNSNAKATAPPDAPAAPAEKKDEGLFSFPPPKVTSSTTIDTAKFLNPQGPTTFANVADKLALSLARAGYKDKYKYFWNDADEFAVVTRIERVDAEGRPLAGPVERWDGSEELPVARDMQEYGRYLISGKKVFYRVFAFVVSRKNYNFYGNSPPSFEMAAKWSDKGMPALGDEEATTIQDVIFTEKYHCYALLYLFVNHNSLDTPKSVDSLEKGEKYLRSGLNDDANLHLSLTNITFGE
jgi:hypothetical protein